MAVGIATCMIAGLTFLPALLNLLGRWRPLIKQPSVDKHSPKPQLFDEYNGNLAKVNMNVNINAKLDSNPPRPI